VVLILRKNLKRGKKSSPQQNKTSVGSIAPRNASSNTTLTGKQLKAAIRKDFNMAKIQTANGMAIVHTVPDCTRHYISARLDPFMTGSGACMPSANFNFPSLKIKVQAAGSMRLGTSGVGYIAFLPAWGSDSANIVTTTATSAGTNTTALSAFTNLASFSFPALPYASASFGTDLQGRFVAGGIRIQYSGTLMNRNGTAYCYCDPDHSSVTNAQTVNTIGNIETTRRINITNSTPSKDTWLCQVTDNGPVVENEIQFAAASSVQATPYMVIAINGVANDLFQWEACEHIELQGRIVPGMSKSHVDEFDWTVADTTMKDAYQSGPPQAREEGGIVSKIEDALSKASDALINMLPGGPIVKTIVRGLTNLVPMGSSGMLGKDGWSGPSLFAAQEHDDKVRRGGGRGSNLRKDPLLELSRGFFELAYSQGRTSEELYYALFPDRKRSSLPYVGSPSTLPSPYQITPNSTSSGNPNGF
jgi:hypothetical protein